MHIDGDVTWIMNLTELCFEAAIWIKLAKDWIHCQVFLVHARTTGFCDGRNFQRLAFVGSEIYFLYTILNCKS
jgi:hypothetical protein